MEAWRASTVTVTTASASTDLEPLDMESAIEDISQFIMFLKSINTLEVLC